MEGLLTVEAALAAVLAHVRPLPAEVVPLAAAAGRVLATDAHAIVDLPPFPSSAMDGFALRAQDAPGSLPVVERTAAGRPAARALAPGEAIAVATGGVVPDGADAVIPIEYVVEHDNAIEIAGAVQSGANVRPRGGDVRAGGVVVGRGTLLGPAQIGALAAAGLPEVECSVRPHAAVTIANPDDLFGLQTQFAGTIVDHDEIIARAVHLGEFQNHGGNV